MEIIGRISRGSKMDQVYLPKNRYGLEAGSYVLVTPLKTQLAEINRKLYFYNTKDLEPVKINIINNIIDRIEKIIDNNNIIITGSFLEKGFIFNDLDILVITKSKVKENFIKNMEINLGLKLHIITLTNKELGEGLSTDPLYSLMLSKCVAKSRILYKTKREINYKLLDINLLKSELLIHNYNILKGNDKYYLIRNLVAIKLFLEDRKISKDSVDKEICDLLKIKNIEIIKDNLIKEVEIIPIYKKIYKKTQEMIFKHIK